MAKLGDVTVNINCNISVSRETAETCLKLVQSYVNETGTDVFCEKKPETGELRLYFEEVKNNGN